MIAQIASGIANKYSGSALASALTGGLWRDQAKQGVSYPFATYSIIDSNSVDTFDKKIEDARIQFTIWHKSSATVPDVKSTLDTLETTLRTLFDYTKLTITSWTNLGMIHIGTRPAFSEDENIDGVIIEYRTIIHN